MLAPEVAASLSFAHGDARRLPRDPLSELALSVVKLGPTDMAFFHQTGALNSRANYSIKSVRANLPRAPYYLLSDGGPDFSEAAGELNVSPFRAEGMHLSQSFNPNFTCHGHLQRIAQAARWASQHGAAYLMIWEDDTRMLKPLQSIPDVDLITMGNIDNKHVGFWNNDLREKSMKTPTEKLAPADQRRVKQQDKYAARRGYSAGPGSILRIDPFLKAVDATPATDLQDMYTYTEQDMCWEDFAIGSNLSIRRNPEVQQVTWAFNDGEFVGQTAEPGRNLRCLECLDACKLYPAAVAEFCRVLRPSTGRAALLTNQANAGRLAEALAAGPWHVLCRRKVLLGHMEAVLFLAMRAGEDARADEQLQTKDSMRLPWEDQNGRRTWSSMKASLRQPMRAVAGGKKSRR
eukprot:s1596_g11.t1